MHCKKYVHPLIHYEIIEPIIFKNMFYDRSSMIKLIH